MQLASRKRIPFAFQLSVSFAFDAGLKTAIYSSLQHSFSPQFSILKREGAFATRSCLTFLAACSPLYNACQLPHRREYAV